MPLETRLESWNPRPPSAKVKARLFPDSDAATAARNENVPVMVWLTPSVCMLFICMFLKGSHTGLSDDLGLSSSSNQVASLKSNLVSFTPTEKDFERQNVWSAVTFEWTSAGSSTTTSGSFAVGKTNIQKL